jgi:hypothetical protein
MDSRASAPRELKSARPSRPARKHVGLVDNLISGGAGVALGAALTYAANARMKRHDLEAEAVVLLEEALTEMQVHAENQPLPWDRATFDDLLQDGERAIGRTRTRLDERHPELVKRAQRAVAILSVGIRTSPSHSDNFRSCLDAYLDAAFKATRAFYAKKTVASSSFPTSREILERATNDPTLERLRTRIEG